MHARRRIGVVVEAVRADAVTDLLDRLGATGWTMLPVLRGRGRQGLREHGVPGGVFDNVLILCLTSDAVAARVVVARKELLGARPAIVSISAAEVLRAEHF